MEPNKNYFTVGAFVLLTILGIAIFSIWVVNGYNNSKYRPYRIHFAESVSGLEVGNAVKFRGVQVGAVDAMSIVPSDTNLIRVDVSILKDTIIKEDTIAVQKLQGVGGGVYIELSGGSAESPELAQNDDADNPPEIKAELSTITTIMEQLPLIAEKITRIADQIDKLLSDKNIKSLSSTIKNIHKSSNDMNQLTEEIKENPTKLIFSPKK